MMNVVKKCLLAATLTLLTTVLTATPAFAQKSKDNRAPANRIVAFGDSLSDTGNIFRDLAFPPPPYFEGRSSNGILWLEYLANDM